MKWKSLLKQSNGSIHWNHAFHFFAKPIEQPIVDHWCDCLSSRMPIFRNINHAHPPSRGRKGREEILEAIRRQDEAGDDWRLPVTASERMGGPMTIFLLQRKTSLLEPSTNLHIFWRFESQPLSAGNPSDPDTTAPKCFSFVFWHHSHHFPCCTTSTSFPSPNEETRERQIGATGLRLGLETRPHNGRNGTFIT